MRAVLNSNSLSLRKFSVNSSPCFNIIAKFEVVELLIVHTAMISTLKFRLPQKIQFNSKFPANSHTVYTNFDRPSRSFESRGRRNQLRSWWGNRSSNAGTRGLFHRRHQRDKISAEHFYRTPKSHKRSDILCIDESRPEIILNGIHWRFPNAKRVSILFANMFFILNSS
ncbi:unnamed protein product [Dracunculus medinensis]|uniref:Uncharacterized protein n=1 Tax=Dracunculus medinensis TaxID=318479 RepID=A0A0N4UR49_DRAME|nr:unnamed protein product [Dracunculus medinensis]